MAEFMVNIKGLKEAVISEEEIEKELQRQIENINRVMSSSVMGSGTYKDISESLKITLQQLQDTKRGVTDYKNGLIEIISLYEKTEKSISENETVKSQLKESKQNLEKILDNMIQQEKYGENDKSTEMSEDPVNLSTGNFIYDHTDLRISGEIPLSFRRFYNALDSYKGTLGVGFLHNYAINIDARQNNSSVTVCMGDGQRKIFIKGEDGRYLGERAAVETLIQKEEGYQLQTAEGECYYFDREGMMLRQENQNGRGINFYYNKKKLLQRAENDNGINLYYQYDDKERITCVSDEAGRKVLLSYDKEWLKQVQMADGKTISYTYNKDGLMEQVENEQQTVVLQNAYQKDGRVERQDFPDGGCMLFSYDDVNHRTTLTERNGSKVIYIQDEKYRNTDIIYEDGTQEHFEYNGKNQKIKAVDRNGNTCRMAYDSKGNLTQLAYGTGLKINYTYNSRNRLLCFKVNGKEKLHNTYDSKGNLILAVSADGAESKVTYDTKGRVIRLEEEGGKTTRLSYDAKGNITKIKDALGNETGYVYDGLGRVIQTTDAKGADTFYTYDVQDRLVRVINPLGAERKYHYTSTGKITEVIDFDGYKVKLSYNSLNKVETYEDKEGNKTYFTYDKMWNVASKKSPDGSVTEYGYNSDNRMTQVSLLGEGTKTYEYDGNGNKIAEVDPEGNRTVFIYDAQNRRTAIIHANGETTSYHYDGDGNMTAVRDAMGNEYTYTYDEMGRKISETDPLRNVIKYTYCGGGRIASIAFPNGSRQKYEYDNAYRLIKVTKPDETSISFKYDKTGNIIEETNNLGQTHTYTYDAMNRLTEITEPSGGIRIFAYDAVGHVTKMIDEKGNETEYVYSPNGNLIHVTDALGNEVKYEYDCMNRLIKVEQIGDKEENQLTLYEWNKAGKVVSMTDSLGYQEVYGYTRNGMLQTKTDRDGHCTAYMYDEVGNLTDISYEDGRKAVFSYNALRQLKEIEDWLGKTQIELDALGRPLSVTDPDGKTIQYRWGSAPNHTDMVYPDGTSLHYEYDAAGRMIELSDGIHTTAYTYNEGGRLAEKILPNGIHTIYSYNESGRVENLSHIGAEFTESYHYAYDINGNKTQVIQKTDGKIDESRSFTYEYNAINQLVNVNCRNQTVRRYTYDAFGNRIEKQDYAGESMIRTRYQYNENNQLILEESNDTGIPGKEYSYDGRGNLVQMLQGNQIKKQFRFDCTNQLQASVETVNNRTVAADYSYNALGQCVGQRIFKENMVESLSALSEQNQAEDSLKMYLHYLLDLTRGYNNLLEIQDSTNGREQRFFWDSDVVWMEEEKEKSFYLHDVQGTVTGLADSIGRSRECYEFDEFGIPLNRSGISATQPFGFAGYRIEAAGGIYFAQARRYDAYAGRFISEDKNRGAIAAPFTLNHYAYCWNRPVDMVDLDGLFPTWKDVKDWWNTNVYGEETVISTTTGEIDGGAGIYTGQVVDGTIPSEQYTGGILKRTTIIENGQISNQYSINIPTFDFGDGWKWGIPASLGITVGNGGLSVDANVGIDLGKLNVNIPASVGVSWEDILSLDLGINVGWDKNSAGLDVGVALNAFSNIKIGGHYTNINGNTSVTSKAGFYMRTGYVYVAALAACMLYGVCTGAVDLSTGWNNMIQYIQSLANGVCPLK